MRYVIILLCIMLFGCEKEPLQFFPQNHYYKTSKETKDYDFHDETVVIISPPENNLDFIRVIDDYIIEHYDLDEIYKYDHFLIYFLKESRDTKRIYKDRERYAEYIQDSNNISVTSRFNPDDILLLVGWAKRGYYQKKTQPVKQYSFRNAYDKKRCDSVVIFYQSQNEEEEKLKQCQPSSESGD